MFDIEHFVAECRAALAERAPELAIKELLQGAVGWPHDHRMWAVIGLYGGREDNTFYRRAPEGLATVGDRRLHGGDVAVLGQDVIHSIENPLRQFTGAIHIYGGDFFGTPRSDRETGQERPYNMERARQAVAEATTAGATSAPGVGRPARAWSDPRCHSRSGVN